MSAADPEVSVLMGVYNAAPTLERTLDSVLSQEGVTLEFIVVDDGSTDGSGEILDRRAELDSRLRVVHQANAGLTASLQRAAELAAGKFLARQDAGGDCSLPGRLAKQLAFLQRHPQSAFATCGHRLVDPCGVFLCEETRSQADVDQGLATLEFPGIRGILHPSVMMVASAFRCAGGYRSEFTVAQDIDLWLRLCEIGPCVAVPEVLYDYRFDREGISARRYGLQMAFADLAVRCAVARRAGQAEPPLKPNESIAATHARTPSAQASEHDYFIASCLRRRDARRARAHYLRAWRQRPGNWRALFGAALTW